VLDFIGTFQRCQESEFHTPFKSPEAIQNITWKTKSHLNG